MTTDAPTEYDFSGIPAHAASDEGATMARGTRLLVLLIAPVLGILATVLGILLRAFAEHDIAATAATESATLIACVSGDACATPETASQIVYLARDTGTAALVVGSVLIAVGIVLIVWDIVQRPTPRVPSPEG